MASLDFNVGREVDYDELELSNLQRAELTGIAGEGRLSDAQVAAALARVGVEDAESCRGGWWRLFADLAILFADCDGAWPTWNGDPQLYG